MEKKQICPLLVPTHPKKCNPLQTCFLAVIVRHFEEDSGFYHPDPSHEAIAPSPVARPDRPGSRSPRQHLGHHGPYEHPSDLSGSSRPSGGWSRWFLSTGELSCPQQSNEDCIDALMYPLSVTSLAWDRTVQNNKHQCGSTYESRLRDLFHAVRKAYNRQPRARQFHFKLDQRLHTGHRTKHPYMELTLTLVETDPEAPYLLLSLKEELVDS
ncbi:hypothetical protein NUH87_07375 [Pseudomonas batumici]|uniref:hypothetical protein n=1 Tax=Pseudomonas batumici TaxID=226910 RepID=UPI0030D3EC02